jgi:hypothetical protein
MRSFLSLLLLSAPFAASAQTTPPPATEWCRDKSCPAHEYLVISKLSGWGGATPAPDCEVGVTAECVPNSLPPAAGGPVYIECTRTSTFTHTCNAWVKGPQLQFYWNPNGPFAIHPTTTQADEIELVCYNGELGAGTISVSIASPAGLHSSATLSIDCAQNNL